MSTTLTTKTSRVKTRMVGVFYLLTFLTGGFFFLVGGRLGFLVDLTATVSYLAVTVLFYSLSRGV